MQRRKTSDIILLGLIIIIIIIFNMRKSCQIFYTARKTADGETVIECFIGKWIKAKWLHDNVMQWDSMIIDHDRCYKNTAAKF